VPRSEEHPPFFDINAAEITYDRWFGQNLLDRLGVKARFPLGFSLSYTTFLLSNIQVNSLVEDRLVIKATVENTGSCEGRFVAQVYGLAHESGYPTRSLLGFIPVDVAASDMKEIEVNVSLRPLQR
jgi:hypothetical protein